MSYFHVSSLDGQRERGVEFRHSTPNVSIKGVVSGEWNFLWLGFTSSLEKAETCNIIRSGHVHNIKKIDNEFY